MILARHARSRLAASAAATATIASLLFTGAAFAASPAPSASIGVPHVVVQYGDLNLETERGTAALQRRLQAAAREVCGRPDARELRLAAQARDCARDAMARAVEEIGNPRLAARHAAGRGRAIGG